MELNDSQSAALLRLKELSKASPYSRRMWFDAAAFNSRGSTLTSLIKAGHVERRKGASVRPYRLTEQGHAHAAMLTRKAAAHAVGQTTLKETP